MCVRWESNTPVTKAQRDQIATKTAEQYQLWFEWLYGFDTFPFSNIDVSIVGWAVTDASLLEGSTDGIDVYTNTDSEGAPECVPACGRFFNQDNDYSECPGGEARHYDQSLWLTDGFGGGAGGDWGQRMGREYFMDSINQEQMTILLHEMGHTFGLDDCKFSSRRTTKGSMLTRMQSTVRPTLTLMSHEMWEMLTICRLDSYWHRKLHHACGLFAEHH